MRIAFCGVCVCVCARARARTCTCLRVHQSAVPAVHRGLFVLASGIRGGVIMTAISFAPLSSKCGDSAIRDAERLRRLEGSSADGVGRRNHGGTGSPAVSSYYPGRCRRLSY